MTSTPAKSPYVNYATSTAGELQTYVGTLYEHEVLKRGLAFRRKDSRTLVPTASLDHLLITFQSELAVPIADVIYSNGYHEKLFSHSAGLIWLQLEPFTKGVVIALACADEPTRGQLALVLHKILPAREVPPDREEVLVSFWSLTPNGARAMERSITIAPWQRVKPNYTETTTRGLDHLMVNFRPTRAGQLVLWYGPPGTGKTHALRALCWEWRKWASFHYITDPEVFFGGNANYMLDVLLRQSSDYEDEPETVGQYDDDNPAPQPDGGIKKERKWRLLILEDSGELMVPDAKVQTGQGLSRLLNVVDGLIGQGLKIMVLVTTNEVLKKLHPAVARPGRCASRVEFGEFKKDDVTKWLLAQGKDVASHEFGLNSNVSLAELYAAIGDEQNIAETKEMPVGFLTS